MASCKTTSKGELIAIYRLEFYKNKKKWKFCKNERQAKKDTPSQQRLNETYRVEDEPPDVEPPEPLNDAFLDTDSDENLKEALKPNPPPLTLRRWKNTLLDIKLPPEEVDWAIPDVKAEHSWQPSVEPVRSYEDEWGEDGGWDGVRWGDGMQCVEQVYASELCLSGPQGSRLPVFAGWPAPKQPTDPNMLQDLMQNIGAQKLGQRRNVADAIRQQMDSVGHLGQHDGQLGQNLGQLGQNIAHYGQIIDNVEQNQNFGQLGQNIAHYGQNIDNVEQNVGHIGKNIGHNGECFGQESRGPIFRQNTRILDRVDHSLKNNQNVEPEIFKESLYQNCEIGQIIEQNLRYDEKAMDLQRMDLEVLEPERDLCELARGMGDTEGGDLCVGDACVAGAVAALAEAEEWLTGSLKHFYLEPACDTCNVSLSSGDSAAFVRGAHARPHSSEVDLAVDEPCECANMSANKLAHMSGTALRDALRLYTVAMYRVLQELRARTHQTHKQPCGLSRDVTHESVPTRDTQPQSTAVRDTSLQRPPPGRGRGRLLAK